MSSYELATRVALTKETSENGRAKISGAIPRNITASGVPDKGLVPQKKKPSRVTFFIGSIFIQT